jgi:hypothetical protein
MEIDKLKENWQEKLREQDQKIAINFSLFKKLTEQNVSSSLDKILTIQKLGTYFALVYAAISFGLGLVYFTEYYYSIPLLIAGFLMIYSFLGHYKQLKAITTIGFEQTAVKDYLKIVLLYEDWIFKSKKADFIIVFIWFTSIAPLYAKYVLHMDIYHDSSSLLIFIGVSVSSALLMNFFAEKIYKDYNKKFKVIKNKLEEILEFENEM